MKLLTQTTLYYLLVTLLVFGIGGIITYNVFQDEVDKETDYYLVAEIYQAIHAIKKGVSIEDISSDNIHFEALTGVYQKSKPIFSDTLAFHKSLKRMEPHQKVSMVRKIGGTYYRITNFGLVIETDDLYEGVFWSLSKIFGLLVIVITVFSFLISKSLFRPFHETLQKIHNFRLQDPYPLHFDTTRTREFADLNEFIAQMTGKIQQDYRNLKEFTENASHEIQTPLAIAKGKLELLMETPNLQEDQVQLIKSTYSAIIKLSRLGHSLALLSKIENHEFANAQAVDLSELLDDMAFNFKELMGLKNLDFRYATQEAIFVNIDPVLADILLTNLLQNAIRHNEEGGFIQVSLTDEHLRITNSGPSPDILPQQLFERFRKARHNSESIGLGLSIVKEICELSNWDISYQYHDELHTIQVIF